MHSTVPIPRPWNSRSVDDDMEGSYHSRLRFVMKCSEGRSCATRSFAEVSVRAEIPLCNSVYEPSLVVRSS